MKSQVHLLTAALLLSGCDSFPGPTLQNDYSADIEITSTLATGESQAFSLMPCEGVRLSYDSDNAGGRIAVVTIAADGSLLYTWDSKKLEELKRMEKSARGNLVWSIGPAGLKLSPYNQSKECIARLEERNRNLRQTSQKAKERP